MWLRAVGRGRDTRRTHLINCPLVLGGKNLRRMSGALVAMTGLGKSGSSADAGKRTTSGEDVVPLLEGLDLEPTVLDLDDAASALLVLFVLLLLAAAEVFSRESETLSRAFVAAPSSSAAAASRRRAVGSVAEASAAIDASTDALLAVVAAAVVVVVVVGEAAEVELRLRGILVRTRPGLATPDFKRAAPCRAPGWAGTGVWLTRLCKGSKPRCTETGRLRRRRVRLEREIAPFSKPSQVDEDRRADRPTKVGLTFGSIHFVVSKRSSAAVSPAAASVVLCVSLG